MSRLPLNRILMEKTIRESIVQALLTSDLIRDHVKVHPRKRITTTDEMDRIVSCVADPDTDEVDYPSYIYVGVPVMSWDKYSGVCSSQVTMIYPLGCVLGARDRFEYPIHELDNSFDLLMAIYMEANRVLTPGSDGFGYNNLELGYLNQVGHDDIDDEETGGMFHVCKWSLRMTALGV